MTNREHLRELAERPLSDLSNAELRRLEELVRMVDFGLSQPAPAEWVDQGEAQ